MSKRGAGRELTKDIAESNERWEEPVDPPKTATAAQMANRKIKSVRGRARPQNAAVSVPMPLENPFAAPAPSFGQSAPQPAAQTSFGSNGSDQSSSSFNFGASSQPSTSFGFGQSQPQQNTSFGFGSSQPPQTQQANGSFGFGQQPQQSSSLFSFGGGSSNSGGAGSQQGSSLFSFGQSQPENVSTGVQSPATQTSTLFGSQQTTAAEEKPATPASNPFNFGQSSTAPSSSTFNFGQQSTAPQSSSLFSFGQQSTAPPAASQFSFGQQAQPSPQKASNPFGFSQSEQSAPQQTSTPFGSTQGTQPTSQSTSTAFGSAQESQPSTQPTTQSSLFNFGGSTSKPASSTEQTAAPAFGSLSAKTPEPPSNSLFNFKPQTQEQERPVSQHSDKPAAEGFKFFGASQSQSKPAEAKPAESSPAPSSLFNFGGSTPKPASGMFNAKPQEQATPAQSTPAFSFGGSASQKEDSTPRPSSTFTFGSPAPQKDESTPRPSTPSAGFSFQGSTQQEDSTPRPANDFAFGASTSQKEQPKSVNGFAFGNASEKEQPKPASGFSFGGASQTEPPKPASGFTFGGASPAKEQPKPANGFAFGGASPQKEQATPPAASLFSFGGSTQQKPVEVPQESPAETVEAPKASESALTSSMPTLTSGSAPPAKSLSPTKAAPVGEPAPTPAAGKPELPNLLKAHVPKSWSVSAPDESLDTIPGLAVQLATLNDRYRAKLATLTPMADWTALSAWHQKESVAIVEQIVSAKKQHAAAKGVTGHESSLSVKRKADEEPAHEDEITPSAAKKAKPTTETTFSSTPSETAPSPSTHTSSLFGKIVSDTPASAAPAQEKPSGFSFTPTRESPSESEASTESKYALSETSKPGDKVTPGSGFSFKPSSGASKPASGFSFAGASSTPAAKSGFSFGGSSTSGGLLSAFAKTAKTYEELAAERKKKAMEEDYDSDDETEEEWSARYDREEAKRREEEEKKKQSSKGFSFGASSKKPAESSTKPVSGASTPALFSPRVGSPAPSTSGGASVFDSPGPSKAPPSNIFGHLSSNVSSASQDDSDDDNNDAQESDEAEEEPEEQSEDQSESDHPASSSQSKRSKPFVDSSSEEETTKRPGSRPSLLSRMTRADDDEDEQDSPAVSNGVQTPNKPFAHFDFAAAAAQSAPPKSDGFAGDQTYKPDTPIKFSAVPATEKKTSTFSFGEGSTTPTKAPPASMFGQSTGSGNLFQFNTTPTAEKKDGPTFGFSTPTTEKKDAPTFQFQPATPSPAEFAATPSKPFAFLGQSTGLTPFGGKSGPGSVTSSVFSSRATTPLSEAETSGKDSAAETEDEDAQKAPQLNLSELTEDELAENDILFQTDQAIAKKMVENAWQNFARGPLWILKNKETGKAFVRMRLASGATPLNYSLLPKLQTTVVGASKKMVSATRPNDGDGKLVSVYYAFKNSEIAEEFSTVYNSNLP